MFKFDPVLAIGSVIIALIVIAASSTHGWERRPNFLTFNGRFALPNTTLQRGTYIFEVADQRSGPCLVRVLSPDRSHVHWSALTKPVERPTSLSDDLAVLFGEAPTGEAPPITVWYPEGEAIGHRFIYG